jgi:hypothetical protein
MDANQPNQKQISDLYRGEAGYPRRWHYFRRLRLYFFVGLAIVSVITSFVLSRRSKQAAFSPGGISQDHASFAKDCAKCHVDGSLGPVKLGKLVSLEPLKSPLSLMDEACIKCHPSNTLHLPQAVSLHVRESLNVREPSNQLTLVHATSCATCHREHIGRVRMALPSEQACVACHSSESALAQARVIKQLAPPSETGNVASTVWPTPTVLTKAGVNGDLGDGVVRYLTPERSATEIGTFTSFSKGHPNFPWESKADGRASPAKDPTALQFSHLDHLSPDFPHINGHPLGCGDCHQPGPDRAYMQPVEYEKHCAKCHTLQIQTSLMKLVIPHGDPEKVRYFLASIPTLFELALREKNVTDAKERASKIEAEIDDLSQRISGGLAGLQQRVFMDGDTGRQLNHRPSNGDLTACASCHLMSGGDENHAPKIQKPEMPERWLQHSPFTHLPHEHMKCWDCHAMALASTKATDILLPSRKLCTECHRPPVQDLSETESALAGDPVSAAAQRVLGGVKWDCTDCHKFHAPDDAEIRVNHLVAPTQTSGPTPPSS